MCCLAIPSLIFWALILPGLFMRDLYKNRENLENIQIRFKYGFLYQEYKEKLYYWEFCKSYLKLGVVAIHNFYGEFMFTKGILIGFIVLLYYYYSLRKNPYFIL